MAKTKKRKMSHGGAREDAGRPDSGRSRFVTSLSPELIKAIRDAARRTKRPHTQFLDEFLWEYMPDLLDQFEEKLLDELGDEDEDENV